MLFSQDIVSISMNLLGIRAMNLLGYLTRTLWLQFFYIISVSIIHILGAQIKHDQLELDKATLTPPNLYFLSREVNQMQLYTKKRKSNLSNTMFDS